MKRDQRRKRWAAALWAGALVWTLAMFLFSLQTGTESGRLSGRLAELLLRALPFLGFMKESLELILRKTAHFCMFVLEGALIGGALWCTRPGGAGRILGRGLGICVPLAVLSELAQLLSEGRSCEVRDMAIDAAGALAGLLVLCLLLCRHRKTG